MEYGLCFEKNILCEKTEHVFPSTKLCTALLWQNGKLTAFNIFLHIVLSHLIINNFQTQTTCWRHIYILCHMTWMKEFP